VAQVVESLPSKCEALGSSPYKYIYIYRCNAQTTSQWSKGVLFGVYHQTTIILEGTMPHTGTFG
jgi:hypothetical protein